MARKSQKPQKDSTKIGAPEKLTDEVQTKIVAAVRAGAFVETAAAAAGICKATLYNWMRDGARFKTGKYKDFLDAINKAFAEASVADMALIGLAAQRDWRAAAYRLEKRMPEEYGPKEKMSLAVSGSISVEGVLNELIRRRKGNG